MHRFWVHSKYSFKVQAAPNREIVLKRPGTFKLPKSLNGVDKRLKKAIEINVLNKDVCETPFFVKE